MKKFLMLILVVMIFVLGSQTSFGQSTIEINKDASESTASLKKQIKFNTDKEHRVYQSYMLYQRKMHHISAMNSTNSESVSEEKKKVYSELCDNLKNILSEEQFAQFLEIEKQ